MQASLRKATRVLETPENRNRRTAPTGDGDGGGDADGVTFADVAKLFHVAVTEQEVENGILAASASASASSAKKNVGDGDERDDAAEGIGGTFVDVDDREDAVFAFMRHITNIDPTDAKANLYVDRGSAAPGGEATVDETSRRKQTLLREAVKSKVPGNALREYTVDWTEGGMSISGNVEHLRRGGWCMFDVG